MSWAFLYVVAFFGIGAYTCFVITWPGAIIFGTGRVRMSLELVVESLDNIAEALKGEYTKGEDGKFRLNVNGIEDVSGLKSALQKERDNVKELKAKYAAYEGIDPEKAQEALQKLRDLEEKKLIEAGELEKVLENRTKMMRQDHQAQVEQLTKRAETAETTIVDLQKQLATAVIERGIADAVGEVGQPRKGALIDIIQRGRQTWKLDDKGKPVAVNEDGTAIYGKDGKEPISMKEWAQNLLEQAPHLFEESKGGGGRGSVVGADGKSMSLEELAKLPPAQRIAFARGQRK